MRVSLVVPCHGREELTAVCLRQLAWTRDQLDDVSVVLVASSPAVRRLARDLDFAYYERPNLPLGRKWNDGFQFALARQAAEAVVPFGSDDWISPELLVRLVEASADGAVGCTRDCSIVAEDGRSLARLKITYPGGIGICAIPAGLLAAVGGRPADDDRNRGIDGSIRQRLKPTYAYVDSDPLQLVDFKTPGEQLNPYPSCRGYRVGTTVDALDALANRYPAEAVEAVAAVYGRTPVAA